MTEDEMRLDMLVAELDYENRLLRARNERLEAKQWVGLTEQEAHDLWESTDSDWELMKRTEAKLKEKNV